MLKEKIAVIGLGYVGLPLAVVLAKKFEVIGYDINEKRVASLINGIDCTKEVSSEELLQSRINFTSVEEDLKQTTFYIVTVPTPIDAVNRPDLKMVHSATKMIGKFLKKGDVVVYESTVYPGVTENECVPILEKMSSLEINNDFGVGYSPERINPGDKKHRIEDIKKVVSGSDQKTLERVSHVYSSVITAGIFEAKNIKTAEAAKVIENIQRDINIALINELSLIFNLLSINTHDVLDAASTKWNFSRFEPGLVGGHCIGVDPYYLTHCAESIGYHPEMILAGRRINNNMGSFVAMETLKGILSLKNKSNDINVVIFGITFKEDVPDIRNTKVIDIIKTLQDYNVNVQVVDPCADPVEVEEEYGIKLSNYADLKPADAFILTVKHKHFQEKGWSLIQDLSPDKDVFVSDLKNCLPLEKKPTNVTLWKL